MKSKSISDSSLVFGFNGLKRSLFLIHFVLNFSLSYFIARVMKNRDFLSFLIYIFLLSSFLFESASTLYSSKDCSLQYIPKYKYERANE